MIPYPPAALRVLGDPADGVCVSVCAPFCECMCVLGMGMSNGVLERKSMHDL